MWDAKTGVPYGSPLTADTSPVNDVAFSPDGRTLVSSHLRSAVVWNMGGEQAIGAPLGGPTDLTTDVSFSHDGTRLAAGRFDGSTIVYDTKTRRQALRIDVGSVVTAVAFHPDGNLVAVGTIDGKVRLFDPKSGAAVGSALDGGNVGGLADRLQPGRSAARGGRRPERRGRVLRPAAAGRGAALGRGLPASCGAEIEPGGGSVLSVAFSRDGTLLATGSYGGRLDLWDVATQARHGKPMRVADDGVLGVAFDPSGRLVAGGGAIGPVRVWRVADQQPAFPPLSGHTGPVTGVAFDPAGSFLATTSAVRRNQAVGPGDGSRLRRRAGRQREARLARADHRPSVPGAAERVQPGRQAAGRRGSRDERGMLWDVDPAVWRRACLRDRGPKPEPRGMEALPAGGDALSRDVLGVAR